MSVFLIFLTLVCGFFFSAAAQENIGKSYDCSNINIHFEDDDELTNEERLRKMERAFYESLDQFEHCQIQSMREQAENSSADGATGQYNGLGEASAASSEMSGQQGDEQDGESSGEIASANDATTSAESQTTPANAANMADGAAKMPQDKSQKRASASGAPPEDRQKVDDDDVVAAQIKRAAELEKDPEKKKQLWAEYRKYKGLQTE